MLRNVLGSVLWALDLECVVVDVPLLVALEATGQEHEVLKTRHELYHEIKRHRPPVGLDRLKHERHVPGHSNGSGSRTNGS